MSAVPLTTDDLLPPFQNRAAAIAANVASTVRTLSVLAGDILLNYVRDPAGTALTTADGATWSPADDVAVDHWGTTTQQSRSAAEAATNDNYAAIQGAIDWCEARNLNVPIYFHGGYYRCSQTPVASLAGISFVGRGMDETHLYATHTNGAALRFKGLNQGVKAIQINASNARMLSAYNSNNFGIQWECDDVPETTETRQMHGYLYDAAVRNQPGVGVYLVGPAFTGSFINSAISGNGWHGIACDRGELSGRVNKPTTGIPGIMTLLNCRMQGNKGHSLAWGNPNSAFSTPALRIVADNCEMTSSDAISDRLYEPADCYMRGTNHRITNSVTTGGGARAAVYVAGRNNHLNNNRYLDCLNNAIIYGSYDDLPSNGLYIDGLTCIQSSPLNPAILVKKNGTVEPKGLSVKNWNSEGIASLRGTDISMGSGNANRIPRAEGVFVPMLITKSANSTVNNTITLLSDPDLRVWLTANEKVYFDLTIHYEGDASADLRVRRSGGCQQSSHTYWRVPKRFDCRMVAFPICSSRGGHV